MEELIAGEMGKKKIDERRLEVLRRQKLMWERRLDSLYKNPDKPKSVEYFIATSARGASRDGAVSAARIRAREIRATFSGGMSLRVDELAHNRMEACYSWEFMTPDW